VDPRTARVALPREHSMIAALLVGTAWAGELAGVSMPDRATVGGQPVVLNGMGLREKYLIDVFVGGPYLTTPTHDDATAIDAESPKRVELHFVYSEVPRDKIVETFEE